MGNSSPRRETSSVWLLRGHHLLLAKNLRDRIFLPLVGGLIHDPEDAGQGLQERLHAGPAGQPLRLVIHEDNAAFRIGDDHAVANGRKRDTKPFLLLLEIGLGAQQRGVAMLDDVERLAVIDRELEELAAHHLTDDHGQNQGQAASHPGQGPLGPDLVGQPLVVQALLRLGKGLELRVNIGHQPVAHLDPLVGRGGAGALRQHGLHVVEPDIFCPVQPVGADRLGRIISHQALQPIKGRVDFFPLSGKRGGKGRVPGQQEAAQVPLRLDDEAFAGARLREDGVGMLRPLHRLHQHEEHQQHQERREENDAGRPQNGGAQRAGKSPGIGWCGRSVAFFQMRSRNSFPPGSKAHPQLIKATRAAISTRVCIKRFLLP